MATADCHWCRFFQSLTQGKNKIDVNPFSEHFFSSESPCSGCLSEFSAMQFVLGFPWWPQVHSLNWWGDLFLKVPSLWIALCPICAICAVHSLAPHTTNSSVCRMVCPFDHFSPKLIFPRRISLFGFIYNPGKWVVKAQDDLTPLISCDVKVWLDWLMPSHRCFWVAFGVAFLAVIGAFGWYSMSGNFRACFVAGISPAIIPA